MQNDDRDVGPGLHVVDTGAAPERPFSLGKMYLSCGSPVRLSIEAIRGVSCPHTKAPASYYFNIKGETAVKDVVPGIHDSVHPFKGFCLSAAPPDHIHPEHK